MQTNQLSGGSLEKKKLKVHIIECFHDRETVQKEWPNLVPFFNGTSSIRCRIVVQVADGGSKGWK